MADYKQMYYIMVDASERAITAIAQKNYGIAKEVLIQAEQAAELLYIETAEDEESKTTE